MLVHSAAPAPVGLGGHHDGAYQRDWRLAVFAAMLRNIFDQLRQHGLVQGLRI